MVIRDAERNLPILKTIHAEPQRLSRPKHPDVYFLRFMLEVLAIDIVEKIFISIIDRNGQLNHRPVEPGSLVRSFYC